MPPSARLTGDRYRDDSCVEPCALQAVHRSHQFLGLLYIYILGQVTAVDLELLVAGSIPAGTTTGYLPSSDI
jgi:hypothetical protein